MLKQVTRITSGAPALSPLTHWPGISRREAGSWTIMNCFGSVKVGSYQSMVTSISFLFSFAPLIAKNTIKTNETVINFWPTVFYIAVNKTQSFIVAFWSFCPVFYFHNCYFSFSYWMTLGRSGRVVVIIPWVWDLDSSFDVNFIWYLRLSAIIVGLLWKWRSISSSFGFFHHYQWYFKATISPSHGLDFMFLLLLLLLSLLCANQQWYFHLKISSSYESCSQ